MQFIEYFRNIDEELWLKENDWNLYGIQKWWLSNMSWMLLHFISQTFSWWKRKTPLVPLSSLRVELGRKSDRMRDGPAVEWRQAQKAKAKSALLMFLSGRRSEWDIKNIWERDIWNKFYKLSWLSQQRCASKSQAQLLWSAFLGWREGCLIRGAEALSSLRVGRSFRFEDLKLLGLVKYVNSLTISELLSIFDFEIVFFFLF